MAEDPNLLRRDILSTFDPAIIGGGTLQNRIINLFDTYPTGDTQNSHMFTHIIQELNRKLDAYGFADQIVGETDAGFRPLQLNLSRALPYSAFGWGVKSLVGGNPKVMQVQRSTGSTSSDIKDFYADEIEDGTLLNWVTENDANADGGVRILYDQSQKKQPNGKGYHFHQNYSNHQPKIVIDGVLSRDTENKVAINGNGAKMQLGGNGSNSVQNFFSSDGSWSLFFVTDFQNYSAATNANVQIIHLTTSSNGGANSPRKPIIACNKANNELSVAQSTQTVGSNVVGNVFLPTYPGEQLLSSFGNPASATNNNEAFLDGVGRGVAGHATTNAATAVNTETDGSQTENILFQPSEVGATTFLSALIYSPSYLFSNKASIEADLVKIFDITFV